MISTVIISRYSSICQKWAPIVADVIWFMLDLFSDEQPLYSSTMQLIQNTGRLNYMHTFSDYLFSLDGELPGKIDGFDAHFVI